MSKILQILYLTVKTRKQGTEWHTRPTSLVGLCLHDQLARCPQCVRVLCAPCWAARPWRALPSGCRDAMWVPEEGEFPVAKALGCWSLRMSLSEGLPSLSFFPPCLLCLLPPEDAPLPLRSPQGSMWLIVCSLPFCPEQKGCPERRQ